MGISPKRGKNGIEMATRIPSITMNKISTRTQEFHCGAKVGTKWEQNRNKMGTRIPKWDKNGNKMGTRWEQEPQRGQAWNQNGNTEGTRTPKWAKHGNKVEIRTPK